MLLLNLIEKRQREGKPVRVRILKARQLGYSTLIEAIIYAFVSRREGFKALVIADDDDGSAKLFSMNKLFHEKLDPLFRPDLKKSNEIALEFQGLNSRIDIDTARNKNAGRGDTYQIIHKSESSRFPYPKEVNLGIANSVPDLPGTMIFDESTANGMNHFYDDWNRSVRGEDGFDTLFVPWFIEDGYAMPLYPGFARTAEEIEYVKSVEDQAKSIGVVISDEQLQWRRFAIAHKCGGSLDLFKQEYPSSAEEAFLASGRPRFDISTLRKLKASAKKPIRQHGLLDIYAEPDPLANYTLGCDTSEGLITGDKSSVIIINCKTFSVDAEYNGLLAPDILANYLEDWANLYNKALAVIEINNHGLATVNELKHTYFNIYYRKTFDKTSNEWKESIGWKTDMRTKHLMVDQLDQALRSNLQVPSHGIIDELFSFVYNDDGTTTASQGKHDDRVIGLALAVQGWKESIAEKEKPEVKPERHSMSWWERMAKEQRFGRA